MRLISLFLLLLCGCLPQNKEELNNLNIENSNDQLTSTTRPVTIDPAVPITIDNYSSFNIFSSSRSVILRGRCSSNIINLSMGNFTFNDEDCSDNTWSSNPLVFPADGTYNVSLFSLSSSGTSFNIQLTIYIDQVNPYLRPTTSFFIGDTFFTNNDRITINGTCSQDIADISLITDGPFILSDSDCTDGRFQITDSSLIFVGIYNLQLTVRDRAGNTVIYDWKVDSRAHISNFAVTNVPDNSTITSPHVQLEGSCQFTGDLQLKVEERIAAQETPLFVTSNACKGDNGRWVADRFTFPREGDYIFTFTGTTITGLPFNYQHHVSYDELTPNSFALTAPVSINSVIPTNQPTLEISGTCGKNVRTVTITNSASSSNHVLNSFENKCFEEQTWKVSNYRLSSTTGSEIDQDITLTFIIESSLEDELPTNAVYTFDLKKTTLAPIAIDTTPFVVEQGLNKLYQVGQAEGIFTGTCQGDTVFISEPTYGAMNIVFQENNNGQGFRLNQTSCQNGSFQFYIDTNTRANVTYNYEFYSTDIYGNQAATSFFNFYLEDIPPAFTLTENNNFCSHANIANCPRLRLITIDISGSCSNNTDSISLVLNDATSSPITIDSSTCQSTGTWQQNNVSVKFGENTFLLTATNARGLETKIQRSLYNDFKAYIIPTTPALVHDVIQNIDFNATIPIDILNLDGTINRSTTANDLDLASIGLRVELETTVPYISIVDGNLEGSFSLFTSNLATSTQTKLKLISDDEDVYSNVDITFNYHGDPLSQFLWHLQLDIGTTQFVSSTIDFEQDSDINYRGEAINYTGKGVNVAIVDDGLYPTHPEFTKDPSNTIAKSPTVLTEHKNFFAPSDTDTNYTNPIYCILEQKGILHHGTMVTGLIASSALNKVGLAGIAPEVGLSSYNIISDSADACSNSRLTNNFYREIVSDPATTTIDVYNNSWGSHLHLNCESATTSSEALYLDTLLTSSTSCVVNLDYVHNPDNFEATMQTNSDAVYLKAAGNEYSLQTDYSLDQLFQNPYYTVVGALSASYKNSDDGRKAHISYSSTGAGLWISAPGGGTVDTANGDHVESPLLLSTDAPGCDHGSAYNGVAAIGFQFSDFDHGPLASSFFTDYNSSCDYTSMANGTSAATPLVSGVVALMQDAYNQANANDTRLSRREVNHILASTAVKIAENDIYNFGWFDNAAGFSHHHRYGFGAIDAKAAVEMAKNHANSANPDSRWSGWDFGSTQKTRSFIIHNSLSGGGDTDQVVSDTNDGTETKFVEKNYQTESAGDLFDITKIESIVLTLVINTKRPGDLEVTLSRIPVDDLTEPHPTSGLLGGVHETITTFGNGLTAGDLGTSLTNPMKIVTNAHYGENPDAIWRLTVTDKRTGSVEYLQLSSASATRTACGTSCTSTIKYVRLDFFGQ